jgi:hypothetical protein
VHHNVVYNLTKLAFGLDAQAQYSHDIEYYDNIAHNNAHGFIVEAEQGGTAANVKVYNNIAYSNSGAGFLIPYWALNDSSPKQNVEFANNTSYKNGQGIMIDSSAIVNIIIRNNILFSNSKDINITSKVPVAQITQDHNLTTDNPLFVNPAGANFHLQSGSPAINSGTSLNAPTTDFDGNSRPQGAGYDIGAYEYTSSTPPAPADYRNFLTFIKNFTNIFDFNALVRSL